MFTSQIPLPRSLCFLKLKQWQHSVNTATRALQGDKDPVDPKENVLPPEKKAKALFRRALAQKDAWHGEDWHIICIHTSVISGRSLVSVGLNHLSHLQRKFGNRGITKGLYCICSSGFETKGAHNGIN